ncbi:MAG: L-serine ammonia-lyase, iron-sulfur-dependent, subunit alpha, partial [Clostridia bacterium]|nr:L-serine ammonia-lyase, iron-sulfur-dependent, subunit alpha [Clostridia bacterium]
MKSLKELYRIGVGPSSSHSMGPEAAALRLKSLYPDAHFKITLCGSLALTGKGHGTDAVLKNVLGDSVEIIFDGKRGGLPHPNTLYVSVERDGKEIASHSVMSVGGGRIVFEGEPFADTPDVYALNSFEEIKNYLNEHDMRLPDYVFAVEPSAEEYLQTVWQQMKATLKEGLNADGELPGGLNVKRKAKYLWQSKHIGETEEVAENRVICAYAFAVGEQNAAGGTVVTAPTCGACGVVPAVMYYMKKQRKFTDEQIVRALAAAGVVGNLIKTNASISGAECGCQAEIGSACSMAAAGLAELYDMDIEQIECAAEVAMEHHLGLTCDPVNGLVQIPCIERNAVAAMRAINAVNIANFLTYTRKVSLDTIITTMYETVRDLSERYRETSEGGLAKLYKE